MNYADIPIFKMKTESAFLTKMEDLVRQVVKYYNISCYRIDTILETHQSTNNEPIQAPVIRIVGFFEDTVSKLEPILNHEFDVSILNNITSESVEIIADNARRFSIGLKANRLDLPEYKTFASQKVEVHVTSILQDVYAAMKNDLSKGNGTIPSDVARDFYRVGALLETADIEFVKIRDLATAKSHVSKATSQSNTIVIPEVTHNPQSVNGTNGTNKHEISILPKAQNDDNNNATNGAADTTADGFNVLAVGISDIVEGKNDIQDPSYPDLMKPNITVANAPHAKNGTPLQTPVANNAAPEQQEKSITEDNTQMTEAILSDFVRNSAAIKEVDRMIAERAGAKINDEIDIEGDVERLRFLKVFTIKQLHERITENKEDIVAFAEKWIGKDNGGSFDSGICLFYLEYLLVAKMNNPGFAVEYVLKFISDNDYSARYIIPTYNAIKQTAEPTSYSHLTIK